MQKVVLVQVTARSSLLWALLVLADVTTVRLLPFHFSISVCSGVVPSEMPPTAMQKAVLVQLTPNSSLAWVAGSAEVTSVQLLPFHFSASVRISGPVLTKPTARQNVALVQLTPDSRLSWVLLVSGVLSNVQRLPFHFSARVWPVVPLLAVPTAMQNVALTQLTQDRKLVCVALVSGAETFAHFDPFHFSVQFCATVPLPKLTTAMQNLALTQLTSLRSVPCVLLLLGDFTVAQRVPFHFSIRVWSAAVAATSPTAID